MYLAYHHSLPDSFLAPGVVSSPPYSLGVLADYQGAQGCQKQDKEEKTNYY